MGESSEDKDVHKELNKNTLNFIKPIRVSSKEAIKMLYSRVKKANYNCYVWFPGEKESGCIRIF